jgi:hypothetical protein
MLAKESVEPTESSGEKSPPIKTIEKHPELISFIFCIDQ